MLPDVYRDHVMEAIRPITGDPSDAVIPEWIWVS